jgi:hypothetical protein
MQTYESHLQLQVNPCMLLPLVPNPLGLSVEAIKKTVCPLLDYVQCISCISALSEFPKGVTTRSKKPSTPTSDKEKLALPNSIFLSTLNHTKLTSIASYTFLPNIQTSRRQYDPKNQTPHKTSGAFDFGSG